MNAEIPDNTPCNSKLLVRFPERKDEKGDQLPTELQPCILCSSLRTFSPNLQAFPQSRSAFPSRSIHSDVYTLLPQLLLCNSYETRNNSHRENPVQDDGMGY